MRSSCVRMIQVVLCLALGCIPGLAIDTQSPSNTSLPSAWKASPSNLPAGASRDIILTAPDACATEVDSELGKATVSVQAGMGVTASNPRHSLKCELTITLTTDASAATNSVRITVMSGDTQPVAIGEADLSIISSPPGPIPPGLDPQVDAMWQVEDYKVIRDNYGKSLADRYLGVIIKLGNDTGYNLILDGVAFMTLRQPIPPCADQPNCSGMPNPVPSETPTLLQGVVANGQTYSARNVFLRGFQWASLLTTGFIPFFKAPVASANYSTSIAIFNGPFINGFMGQFPDPTVQQLQRLNSSGVLNNSNELDNNSSATYLAFVPRRSICNDNKTYDSQELSQAQLGAGGLWGACGGKNPSKLNPALLTRYLQKLVLVGTKVPAANARFRVVTNSASTSINQLTADSSVIAGIPKIVNITPSPNSNIDLTGATIVSNQQVVTVSNQSATKTALQAQIYAHTLQSFTLQVQLKDTSIQTVSITVNPPQITASVNSSNLLTLTCTICQTATGDISTTDWNLVQLTLPSDLAATTSQTLRGLQSAITLKTPPSGHKITSYTISLVPLVGSTQIGNETMTIPLQQTSP
jgi:hypothetical protein